MKLTQEFIDLATLVFTGSTLVFLIIQFLIKRKDGKDHQRLTALKDLISGFDTHNWQFIHYWDFPGVYPYIDYLQANVDVVQKDIFNEAEKQKMGKRVVVLSHLNILLQVYTQRKFLKRDDIEGYRKWATSWLNSCDEPLKTIFKTGDVYPLDFIKWLDEDLLANQDLHAHFGQNLKDRFALVDSKGKIINRFLGR